MNTGLYRVVNAASRNGGYSVVRDPDEVQKVTAVLSGEGWAAEPAIRGPLSFTEAIKAADNLNGQSSSPTGRNPLTSI